LKKDLRNSTINKKLFCFAFHRRNMGKRQGRQLAFGKANLELSSIKELSQLTIIAKLMRSE